MLRLMLTSEEWQEQIKDICIVMDPDGWRRKGDPDWKTSLITKEDFIKRRSMSTCQFIGKDAHSRLSEWDKKD